jgi:hypothetical protein
VDEASKRNMKLIPHQELEKFRDGQGDDTAWNTIVCRLNLGSVLCIKNDFNEEAKWAIRDALDAMRKVAETYNNGKYTATDEQITDIHDGLYVTDEVQDTTTRREQRDALKVVMQVAV